MGEARISSSGRAEAGGLGLDVKLRRENYTGLGPGKL